MRSMEPHCFWKLQVNPKEWASGSRCIRVFTLPKYKRAETKSISESPGMGRSIEGWHVYSAPLNIGVRNGDHLRVVGGVCGCRWELMSVRSENLVLNLGISGWEEYWWKIGLDSIELSRSYCIPLYTINIDSSKSLNNCY